VSRIEDAGAAVVEPYFGFKRCRTVGGFEIEVHMLELFDEMFQQVLTDRRGGMCAGVQLNSEE
jgi:hypothetical protein